MPKTKRPDPNLPLKRAFVRGYMRLAEADADAVKLILVAGDFIGVNDDGSIVVDDRGWFTSCLLPQHTVMALGLLVGVRRWERLRVGRLADAGLPTFIELLTFIGEHIVDDEQPAEYARWGRANMLVYRDHAAWLTDIDLVVDTDPVESESDGFYDAIADFLIAATGNKLVHRKGGHGS